jgi:hypothetical protein
VSRYTRWVLDANGLTIQDMHGNDLLRLEPLQVNMLLMDITSEAESSRSYEIIHPGPAQWESVWGPAKAAP